MATAVTQRPQTDNFRMGQSRFSLAEPTERRTAPTDDDLGCLAAFAPGALTLKSMFKAVLLARSSVNAMARLFV